MMSAGMIQPEAAETSSRKLAALAATAQAAQTARLAHETQQAKAHDEVDRAEAAAE